MLSDNNSDIYKKLYSEKNIDKILSDASFVKKILLFEKMLLKANYQLKNVPHKAYQNISKAIRTCDFQTYQLQEDLEYSGVLTINILNKIKKNINKNYIFYLHYGATSQDAIDTAMILQIKEARSLITNNLKKISSKLFNMIKKNTNTFTVARTRNKIATLTTFSYKASNWLLPILRNLERLNKVYDSGLLTVQLGGPIGDLSSFNNKGNLIKEKLSAFLGLEYDNFNWQNQRDRIIDFCNILSMITGSIGKIAKDLLVLSQDEVSEISFRKYGVSSSMRHKNNPIIAELLVALSKLNANRLSLMHETLMHQNERDGISWIVEWNTLYSMLRFTNASLSHFNKCISSLKLNKGNMKKNIDNTYGLIMSDFFYKELLKKYSASKLDKIFPSFIDKALKEKKDLLDIVNSYLGKNLNINKGTFFSKYTKSNNDLVKSIEKKFSHIL
ncbi:lyase family protein [Alphaproteobacteria bacterium]|nr:lyase family protein [Alphaproteobacteria bacterium]